MAPVTASLRIKTAAVVILANIKAMRQCRMPWNDAAQFCLNGHLVTAYATSQPQKKQKFCEICGAGTIDACPSCGTPFGGAVHDATLGGRSVAPFTPSTGPPPYCRGCGAALPWTIRQLQAAADLADLQQTLTPDERTLLKKGLDDLIRDTPQTTVAALRLKQLAAKAGKSALDGFRSILISVASETAKKILFPAP
jgi:hypothetical protein